MKTLRNPLMPLLVALLALVPLPVLTAQDGAGAGDSRFGDYTLETDLPCLDVLSQGRTGTCWSFATTSFLESEVARITGQPVDLSEIWPVRATILEKAKRYVKTKGKSRFTEGGLSHDVIEMVREYGMVPASAYTGLTEGQRVHNHGELFAVIGGVIKGLAENRRLSPRWEAAVNAVLDTYLGAAPETVTVDGKQLSPKEYARDVLRLPLDRYIEVMSLARADFGKRAELDIPDNWWDYDQYLNVPLDTFMAGIDHALAKGYSVAVDMDVSEPGFQQGKGIASLPAELEKKGAVTQQVRDAMFVDGATGATTDDHLMHVTGTAKGPDGRTWYVTKNSWGAVGPYKGYILVSKPYMRAKALAYMVHEEGLPPEMRGSRSP